MSSERIFISYSRSDSKIVKRLEADLIEEGYLIWRDRKIEGGSLWDNTLESELKKSTIVLLIISPNSAGSDNVKNEVQYAIDEGKRLVPIIIERTDNIPLTWRRYQRIDFTNQYKSAYSALIRTINNEHADMPDHEIKFNKKKRWLLYTIILVLLALSLIVADKYFGLLSGSSNPTEDSYTDPFLSEKAFSIRSNIDKLLIELSTPENDYEKFELKYELIDSDMQSIIVRLKSYSPSKALRYESEMEKSGLSESYDTPLKVMMLYQNRLNAVRKLHKEKGYLSQAFVHEIRVQFDEISMFVQHTFLPKKP